MLNHFQNIVPILLIAIFGCCFPGCQSNASSSDADNDTDSAAVPTDTATDDDSDPYGKNDSDTSDDDSDDVDDSDTSHEGTDADTEDTASDADELTPITDIQLESVIDPYDKTPLVALVIATHEKLSPDDIVEMRVTVKGIDDDAPDLNATLQPSSASFAAQFHLDEFLKGEEVGVPVLGLYANHDNRVTVEIDTNTYRFSGDIKITTDKVNGVGGETPVLHTALPNRMTPGFTWFNNRAYDAQGYLRWYGGTVYHFLQNGHYADRESIRTLFGETVVEIPLPDTMTWHHETLELPNENLLMGITNEASTVTVDGVTENSKWDYIIEVDREDLGIVNAWDMREFLDVGRATNIDKPRDWFHMNTLAYDESDDSIIVSGRHQGIAKVSRNGIQGSQSNEGKTLKWILAPHMGWGLAGADGEGPLDTRDYLLTAVDENDVPFPDDVQNNLAAPSPDPDAFFWPIGQHGLQITFRDGDRLGLLVFNNQASYIFDGPDTTDNAVLFDVIGDVSNDRDGEEMFSQIIEYEIDEVAMTVKKRWSYGEHQPDLYGDFSGGTTLFSTTGNRFLISNGKKRQFDEYPYNAHVVEVTPDGEEVFHLEISDANFNAYRAGRVDLYHPNLSVE